MQGNKINYNWYISKLPEKTWLSGEELEKLWGVDYRVRSLRAKAMCDYGYLRRKGKTASVRYQLAIKHNTSTHKEKKQSTNTNSLDSLIVAASKVGTENEILKTGLLDAKAAIERALKAIA